MKFILLTFVLFIFSIGLLILSYIETSKNNKVFVVGNCYELNINDPYNPYNPIKKVTGRKNGYYQYLWWYEETQEYSSKYYSGRELGMARLFTEVKCPIEATSNK